MTFTRNDYFFLGASFSLPMLLIIGRAVTNENLELLNPTTISINWLYMAAPHLMALLLSRIVPPLRRNFLTPALIGSGLLLITFHAWIWFFVTPRESGLAWVLYIPLWILLIVATAIMVYWQKKRSS